MLLNALTDALHCAEILDYLSDLSVGGDRHVAPHRHGKDVNIDLQAWMDDVSAQLLNMPVLRLPQLLAWNWKAAVELKKIAA